MAKKLEVYKCKGCNNLVEVLIDSEKDLCSHQRVVENTTDAATEKHVPVVEKIEGGYRVTVGSVEHPMTEEHSIQWIELITENNEVLRKYLSPSEKPVADSRPMLKTFTLANIATYTACGDLNKYSHIQTQIASFYKRKRLFSYFFKNLHCSGSADFSSW